ncbi:MAG: hypothetical protein NVV62_01560 [Terricaulis sp.]|nr:hypothetical protein [Terricaulis sp.]
MWLAQDIIDAANKFLFHASDAVERRRVNGDFRLVLAEVTNLHRKLAEIANFISSKLVGDGPCVTGVATAQFDVMHLWDQPFANIDDFSALRQWWLEHNVESNALGYTDLKLP